MGAPDYSPSEATQLSFKAFFNILNNKKHIKQKRKMSKFPMNEKFLSKNAILY